MAFITSVALPHPRLRKRRSTCPTMTVTVRRGHEFYRPAADTVSSSGPLSAADLDHYFREGYVIVRSILSGELLRRAKEGAKKVDAARTSPVGKVYDKLSFRTWTVDPVFLEIATNSLVSEAAAQLVPHERKERGLVVLNDAYFRLKGDNLGCNFHVDDPFFWPTDEDAPGPGMNAWIALDDVGNDGGGLAIAPGSFGEGFLDCRDAIRGNTCMIHETAPLLSKRLENIAVMPQMKAGDCILCTRFLFHRGNPFKKGSEGAKGEGIARYSIRYMPGEAVVNEVFFKDGEVVRNPPVRLDQADPQKYQAVVL